MVKAIVEIDEHANKIINIVKAKYGLKDKSRAINFIVKQYEEDILEPELRPEYIRKAKRIQKQKLIPIHTVKELRKRYES